MGKDVAGASNEGKKWLVLNDNTSIVTKHSDSSNGQHDSPRQLTWRQRQSIKRQIIVLKLSHIIPLQLTAQTTLTWTDLPEIKTIDPGSLDLVTITNIDNPSSFYVVFENRVNYGLMNPSWDLHFPTFESGSEAFAGITCALTMFYATYIKDNDDFATTLKKSGLFVPMELVLIKFIASDDDDKCTGELENVAGVERGSKSYNIRRGVIMGEIKEETGYHRMYKAYLFDCGIIVAVSEKLVFPLPVPFHSIGPLAVHVGLYGISPCGAYWDPIAISQFKKYINDHQMPGQKPRFFAEICSNTPGPLLPRKVVEVLLCPLRKKMKPKIGKSVSKRRIVQFNNFTEYLAGKHLGILWNPFPSRPGLMGGVIPKTEALYYNGERIVKLQGIRVTMRQAVMLTETDSKLFHFLSWFELASDLYRLFRLRRKHLIPITGLTNRMLLYPNPNSEVRLDRNSGTGKT